MADVIFVMERRHRSRLLERFGGLAAPTHVLDIPDEYQFMDPDLVRLLRDRVQPVIDRMVAGNQAGA